METMQPTLKNGRNVWDRINMPEAEFEDRVKRIRKWMREKKSDVLLLYGNGLNDYGNACYISNLMIRGGGRGALVAIPKKGDVTLMFEGPSRGVPSVKETTWIEEVRACGDISKECVNYLKEKNLIFSTVGWAGIRMLMPYDQFQCLSESLKGGKIVDADSLVKEMRMVKSQRECDGCGRSSRIVRRGFDFIEETSFSDVSERKFEALVKRETHFEGAEDFRMLIAKPEEAPWAFRPVEEAPILQGDTVIVYLAVEFERYWSEGIRTFLAEGSSLIEIKSETLQSLYQQIMEGMRRGKKVSQFYREAVGKIRKSKVRPILEYGLGQGIGLSPQEPPVISGKEETPLKEGMCLTLRLGIEDKDRGAIFIGDTLSLSNQGARVLTRREG